MKRLYAFISWALFLPTILSVGVALLSVAEIMVRGNVSSQYCLILGFNATVWLIITHILGELSSYFGTKSRKDKKKTGVSTK